MSNTKEKLFGEFQAPTKQEWLDKIGVDLKGADFQKRLVWKTPEGFSVQPFYQRDDVEKLSTPYSMPGEFPFVRGNKKNDNTWYIRQEIEANDAKAANAKALDILNKGIDSLSFTIPGDSVSAEFVEALLKDIYCDCVELNFNTCKRHSVELAEILVAYFEKKGYDKEKIVGSIDWDPMDKILQGKPVDHIINVMNTYAVPLVNTLKDYQNFRCITINAVDLSNKGAYCMQELGYALAWGNEYMQQLTDAGVDATLAAKKIKFNMGISENYFMEIAKFRAGRMLWAEIVKQYNPQCDCACKMIVNAITTEYNMTIFDAHVNLLRSQTETMSAALAGVHSIVVTPFDAVYEKPDDFSERIARNQQNRLLKKLGRFSSLWKRKVVSSRLSRVVRYRRILMLQMQSVTPLLHSVVNLFSEPTSSLTSTKRAKESVLSTTHVLLLISRTCVSPQKVQQNNPLPSCLPSVAWFGDRLVHSSHATSSLLQDTRLLTILVSQL